MDNRSCPGKQELISIIGNLLDNAIEATQRAASARAGGGADKLNEQELIIEVADQGVGITPEIRERIFERGITTKTRRSWDWSVSDRKLCHAGWRRDRSCR
jgi:sensor histidine kinase regulating citrate/malate metabolism